MKRKDWTLNQWLVLLLVVVCAGLLLEIRYDHNHVLMEKRIAWTPIVYSAVVLAAGALSLAFWDRWGRAAMLWLFGAGLAVGLLGFWLHNMGHPVSGIERMLSAWTGNHPDPTAKPPTLAPLAFAGLGLLGMLACAEKFNRVSERREKGKKDEPEN